MTYERVASITQIAALLLFVMLFVGVLIYAFWPGNKNEFKEDAKIPLKRDPDQDTDDERHC